MSLQGLTLAFWSQQKDDNSCLWLTASEEHRPALLWEGATETRASYRYRPVWMASACPTRHQHGIKQSPHLMCLWDYSGREGNTNSPEGGPITLQFPRWPHHLVVDSPRLWQMALTDHTVRWKWAQSKRSSDLSLTCKAHACLRNLFLKE